MPARLREERIPQAALAVELVDGHVDGRVRGQRPDGAALPHAVLADRYETQFSFGESFGPTAATVCSVRFTLRPPAADATGALYGVGPPVRYDDIDADQDADDGDAEQW